MRRRLVGRLGSRILRGVYGRGEVAEGALRVVGVDDYDMALLKVVYEGVHVSQIHAAALIVAALVDVR